MPVPHEATKEFLCDCSNDPYEDENQEEVSHRIIDRLNDLLFLFNLLDVALERDRNSDPNSENHLTEEQHNTIEEILHPQVTDRNADAENERTVISHEADENLHNDLFSIPLLYFLPRLEHGRPENIEPTNVSMDNPNAV